ncbi:CST complex subunit Ten1 [Rhexocercosporidium sp. MPI-PUGE-AT-0058]|nr:CST complex subunit Ten1 [Rhexocercosporidium sp. MPI-PUGE-AT-0058]
MAGIHNGPIPTKLCLLSDLGRFSLGSKVRFLGCVTNYSTKTAILTLEHNLPPGNLLKALVDVNLLITTLNSNETQIGEWVNVMGYITGGEKWKIIGGEKVEVGVQALVLWSAGPFDLARYERSLDQKAPGGKTALEGS